MAFDDTLAVNYPMASNSKNEKELLLGNGSPGPYYLKQKYIIPDTLSVKLGGIEAREFVDYVYKKNSNSILFYYDVYTKIKPLEISYKYKLPKEKNVRFKDTPFSMSLTYLDESTDEEETYPLTERHITLHVEETATM